jgi:hypothetical protein
MEKITTLCARARGAYPLSNRSFNAIEKSRWRNGGFRDCGEFIEHPQRTQPGTYLYGLISALESPQRRHGYANALREDGLAVTSSNAQATHGVSKLPGAIINVINRNHMFYCSE